MIAACPKCQAKYRVDTDRLRAGEARLRCAKCQAVFRVRAPREAESVQPVAQPISVPQPQTAPQPAPPQNLHSGRAPVGSPTPQSEELPVDRERLILVADPDVAAGKATHAALIGIGLQPILVHDGVEAMMTIQRMLPRAVILDAGLPKMFGFQICELVKRNESLRGIHVALVGSVHRRERYRRPPDELYGADSYLEQPELLERLHALVSSFGYEVTPGLAPSPATQPQAVAPAPAPAQPAPIPQAPVQQAPPAPVPTPVPTPIPVSVPTPEPTPAAPVAATPVAAPDPAQVDDGLSAERANAERLARIIVSDIALYQPEIFERGLAPEQLVPALEGAIAEGRSFFAQRIDERVREEKDYLMEELMRVVRERSGQ